MALFRRSRLDMGRPSRVVARKNYGKRKVCFDSRHKFTRCTPADARKASASKAKSKSRGKGRVQRIGVDRIGVGPGRGSIEKHVYGTRVFCTQEGRFVKCPGVYRVSDFEGRRRRGRR